MRKPGPFHERTAITSLLRLLTSFQAHRCMVGLILLEEQLFMKDHKASDHKDQDMGKGAMEQDAPDQHGNNSINGQLGHRDQDPRIKGSDTDFPEPGENPEHSGEPKKKTA